ncbi:MAG: glycosyltransferase family 9 protein [Bdellovibrio sp.]|nr:glycosyltransferase family 9 protein [Bdellovibrio sp.]
MGDIVQAMAVISAILHRYPGATIDWVSKQEFCGLLELDKRINQIWQLDRKQGFPGLLRLAFQIKKGQQESPYDVIYDAHQNMRSLVLKWILRPFWFAFPRGVYTRSKERVRRMCLFFLRLNFFPKPFRGMLSYLRPLRSLGLPVDHILKGQWNFPQSTRDRVQSLLPKTNHIALAPSAAWAMKRWPVEHWRNLVGLLPNQHFVLLGGPQDNFLANITQAAPERVLNLAGKLSLAESAYAITCSELLVSADTGMIHMADLLGHPGISLMGPTAFGFCSGSSIKTLEVAFPCRPCTKDGRGKCRRKIYQECMTAITPEVLALAIREMKDQKNV